MGYYLISNKNKEQPYSVFVEDLEDIIYHVEGDINDTVIAEGTANSKPYFLRNHLEYKTLCKEKYRNGRLAEKIFRQLAIEQKFMIRDIPQDQKSFEEYNVIESMTLKRADFEIKNCDNIEVDVKCLSFYEIKNKLHFYLRYSEYSRFQNSRKHTNQRIVLSIFNQKTIKTSQEFYSIELLTILKENNKSVRYDESKKCFVIPLDLTTPGFELLENYRIRKDLYM